MSMTVSVRIEHLKSGQVGGQRRHDMREGFIPKYIDQRRKDWNSTLIEPPDPEALQKEIARHRKKAGQQPLRKDARLVMSGIITFGTEAQHVINAMTPEQQDARFQAVADAIAKDVGRPLIGLVVHRDESAPHAHFMIREYQHDETTGREEPARLSKSFMLTLQDVAAEPLADLGITRGKKKKQRIADGDDPSTYIRKTLRQLHEEMPEDLAAAKECLQGIYEEQLKADDAMWEAKRKTEYYQKLLEETQKKIEDATGNLEKLQKRAQIYENRIEKLVESIATLETITPEEVRNALQKEYSIPYFNDDSEPEKLTQDNTPVALELNEM